MRAVVLTAGRNWRLLARQALEFRPDYVVIADEDCRHDLEKELSGSGIRIEAGTEAVAAAAGYTPADTVVTAMVGYSGLIPTIRAIHGKKRIALANKETLVVAGHLITSLIKEHGAEIVPVDSEHSAIHQCLAGESADEASRILLTASGGPFRTLDISMLPHVTAAQALRHPNWQMGAKVTIDSASMMNKGFEMIEARWLFGCPPQKIQVVVHPQSIVHSMVEFADGSIKAQLGVTDMRLPIRYALGYPRRLPSESGHLSLEMMSQLTFETPDLKKFPLLSLAYEAIDAGGNIPCALNAANEIAVDAFLHNRIRFTDMPRLAESVIERTGFIAEPTLEDLIETNSRSVGLSLEILKTLS